MEFPAARLTALLTAALFFAGAFLVKADHAASGGPGTLDVHEEQAELDKEKRLQQAVLNIKKRMGANAILKGMNLEEGATGKARNEQIGGHRK